MEEFEVTVTERAARVEELATEQAALRRVATLVAREASQPEVFSAIAEEVGRLLGTEEIRMLRYESDREAVIVACWGAENEAFAVGSRVSLEGDTAASRVFRTGNTARIDDYGAASGRLAEAARAIGIRSVLAAPILVQGRLWGAIAAGTTRDEPLPAETEERLGQFTELIATAIANADGRADVERLAEEQAALLRLSTLVAEGAPSSELFSAVSDEVAQLFGAGGLVVRFEDDGLAIVSVGVSTGNDIPVGRRWEFEEGMASLEVYRTRRAARVDAFDWPSHSGPAAETAERIGIVSSVSNPIFVENHLWGAITVFSTIDRLPAETEDRLDKFSRLVGTAIASAESRGALEQLADEQAALRRVATLVAEGVPPEDLFAAAAREVQQVLGVSGVVLDRYDADGTSFTTLALALEPGWATAEVGLYVGARFPVEPGTLSGVVYETRQSARINDYSDLVGVNADAARRSEIGSSCGAPIIVEGRVWGAMCAFSKLGSALPVETERRLQDFTDILATALSNIDAREGLRQLADEQAALQRVAMLVAQAVPPSELFSAVSREVGRLFGSDLTVVARFDLDEPATIVMGIATDVPGMPVGSRWELEDGLAAARVYRTGRSARIDAVDWSDLNTPIGAFARRVGVVSTVSCPIHVEGRLWGAITVPAKEPLPPDTEERLEKFTQVVATALANADSRRAVARLADEQAALRRVATLVAEGAPPPDVFGAVSAEIDRLLGLAPDRARVCVVRFDPGPEHVVVAASRTLEAVPLGSRWPPLDLYAPTRVLHTQRSARVGEDDLEAVGGPEAEFLRENGYLSQVSSPIVVDGRLWGAISANSAEELPADTEDRLEKFIELIATAIANSQARDELQGVAAEQAALRRVATLVARGAPAHDVFSAVTEELGQLVPAQQTAMSRYDSDHMFTTVAVWSPDMPAFPLGAREPPGGNNVMTIVLETGRPARINDYSASASGPIGDGAREAGLRSAVGIPIIVEGRLWGIMTAGSTHSEPLPADTETRLASFTELVATAIANAASRAEVQRLADEQAALRRVATLVARGAQPDKVFLAVSEEVRRLFRTALASVGRVEPDGRALDFVRPDGSHERVELADLLASAEVFRTRRSARAHASLWESAEGTTAERLRGLGIVSIVSSPVVVEGEVWGIINVASAEEVLPPDTEERLEKFTEIVATAIANADSRQALARLADEQAALRRVATLVARDAPSTEVFEAVATEVGKLLQTDITVVGRYDGDGAATAIGSWSSSPGGVPVGTRSVLGGRNVLTLVAETGKPARVEGYDEASGEAADIARRHGWRSSIAAPIVVEDRLWGVMLVATQGPEPFPAGAEERLGAFTDLVATALANAQAHDEVRRFGNEQAALGRVATLVAAGAPPEEVFTAVAAEASSLLGLERIELVRYDEDAKATVIAALGDHPFPAGSTWSLDDESVMAAVARTGRAARIDDYSGLKGEIARVAHEAGFRSAIGAPICVEARLWGVMIAISTEPEPISERSEASLGHFTELVATAVANADTRRELERVATEQATLRRIATLVAEGRRPEEIFAAVTEEVAELFDAITAVQRFDPDGPAVLFAGVSKGAEVEIPVGTRWEFVEGMASAEVFRTARPVRLDGVDWASLTSPAAAAGGSLGIVSQIGCPIIVDGTLWGSISVNSREALPLDTEERLEKFTELVATAIANAEGKSELAASRLRIVAAADETRRRIERDLHDGTQQRLVSLGLAVRAVEAEVPPERGDLREELSRVATGLADAVEELQELSRGIHPAILSRGGLGPALETLALRSAVPVELAVTTLVRLPESIEVAAYFVASEALANAAKHAQASHVEVSVGLRDGSLLLSVRDDGIGGADSTRGSGLVGLKDRADALGGTITIESPRGGGTSVVAALPLERAPNTR